MHVFQTRVNGVAKNISEFRIYVLKNIILDEIDADKRLFGKTAELFLGFQQRPL